MRSSASYFTLGWNYYFTAPHVDIHEEIKRLAVRELSDANRKQLDWFVDGFYAHEFSKLHPMTKEIKEEEKENLTK